MRIVLTFLVAILCACQGASSTSRGDLPQSPCRTRFFEGSRFTVCSERGGAIQVATSDSSGQAYRSFATLESALGRRASAVAFAMNAGMFDDDGHAIGLLVERGKQLHSVNRNGGGGNFGLLPNGIFLVRSDGKAEVVPTTAIAGISGIAFATQSGPMLVIDGKLHPKFEPDGESRNLRNGVGIASDGTPVFAISEDTVSFGKFGRFFRDSLKTRNALYFDGSVSSLWDPANGRRDAGAPLGPMVVVFKSATAR